MSKLIDYRDVDRDDFREVSAWANQVAKEEGLRVQPTTTDGTGYPKNEKLAFIGFKNFDQAESLAKNYDLKLVHLEIRDGWTFATRYEGEPYEAFDLEEIEPDSYEEGDERYAMEYHDDVTTYIIGALID